jgi:predicted O-methyltransferase YrrM
MIGSLFKSLVSWVKFLLKITYSRNIHLLIISFFRYRIFLIPQEVWCKIDRINGFLNRREAGLLYWAACRCPLPGFVIELGSYKGRSTGIFALAGRQVYAVDAWSSETCCSDVEANDVFNSFKFNIREMGVGHLVNINRGMTHQIGRRWDKECAILFIDAGHTYEEVRSDLNIWTPNLHPQGFLILHDVLGGAYWGVTRAAGELLTEGWEVIASSGSAVVFTRK